MAAGGDTIVALSSGRPPAAIAVIRMSGPGAEAAAEAIGGAMPEPRQAALRNFRDPVSGEVVDQGLMLHFPGPHSVTGEDIIEFQCHGGRAVVERLLDLLLAQPGVRLAEPGEFTRRALAHGRIDLTEAEGLADLLAAETEIQRRAAQQRVDGVLRRRLEGWRVALLELAADAEVAIDYPDEEDGMIAPNLNQGIERLLSDVRALAEAPPIKPLRDGFRVVVAGPPNAGKSSLINVLSRSERSIVTPLAGTTRDVIEVPIAIHGIPFVLVDTAGLRTATDEVEAIGVDRAARELEKADLVLWLGDNKHPPIGQRILPIRAKCDIAGTADDRPSVSAMTGEGIDSLMRTIVERAKDIVSLGDEMAITRRERGLVEQMIAALNRAVAISDPLFQAEELRLARHSLDQITGRLALDDVLDALFGRFCLGK